MSVPKKKGTKTIKPKKGHPKGYVGALGSPSTRTTSGKLGWTQ